MVFYFSGTGNSQLAAVQIAEATGDGLVSVNRLVKLGEPGSFQSERPLVFVAPTYSWRLPRVVEQWMEAAEFAGKTVVCQEVGGGVIPMDAQEREWRECTGRLCCDIAAQADRVYRVYCGIATCIKGAS